MSYLFQSLVSIIIPAYNCENYIGATIETALNQTWQNKEIIIVDDGSTDNSLAIAKAYEQKYEQVKVLTQKNIGACNARNNGFAYSKGDLIQFLDGDDLMAPNKIQCQIEYLNGDLDCIVACNWIKFRDEIKNTIGGIGPYHTIKKDLSPIDWLLQRYMMAQHAWLIPRKIVEQVGGWNEALTCNQDGEFTYRIVAASKKVLFAKDTIVYYRIPFNHNGVSLMNAYHKYESLFTAALAYKNIVQQLSNHSIDAKVAVGNFFRELAYNYYYPKYPVLYKKCIEQEEFSFGTQKPLITGKSKLLAKLVGWKLARRIQYLIK